MEKDPNGVAAAIVVIVTAIAAVFGVSVDSEAVQVSAGVAAGALNLIAVLLARRKAWAPDTVRALPADFKTDASGMPPVPLLQERREATRERRGLKAA